MVILHGLLGSSRNWQMAGRDLSARYHVRALDLRNHGASPHSEVMNYEIMVADVLAWMETRGLWEVDLVGHSMGGKTAMLLACRHPERVRRLVVVDIAPKDYFSMGHRAEFAAMHELRLEGLRSRAEAELHMEGRVSDWAMRKFLLSNLESADHGGWRWRIDLPALTAALPALEKNPLSDADIYRGPTLFIVGGRSRYVNAGDHGAIEHHFPGAAVEVIAESGHNPHMDAREPFVRLVSGGNA